MHDGGGGEQDVQVDPDGTQGAGQGPGVVCREQRTRTSKAEEGRLGFKPTGDKIRSQQENLQCKE